MTKQGVFVSAAGSGIATVTFGHPSGNSLPGLQLKKLTAAIDQLATDTNIKVIILKSEGRGAFCAGASLSELVVIEDAKAAKRFFCGFADVINALRKCPKFVIGRVQGKAVGGGVGLIAATDYCFATVQAAVRLSELSIGIGPFVIAPAIERKAGIAALSELSVNATHWHDARWAQQRGLYTQLCDSIEEMDNEVIKLAQKMASYSTSAMEMLKKTLWNKTEHWDDLLDERAEISGRLLLSEYAQKALKAFGRNKSS